MSKITRKYPVKNKRAQIYQCLESTCKQQFSATSDTIFADSHLPHKWFLHDPHLIAETLRKGCWF